MLYFFYVLLFILPRVAWGDSIIEQPEASSLEEKNSDVHGQFDVVFKNDYITTRGLLVTNTGVTTQVLISLSLDLYKNPDCWLEKISIFAGIWNDVCSSQHNPKVGQWVELDWFAGFQFKIAKDWLFAAQFLEFLSPPGNFKAEKNIEFLLSYDDSRWQLPVTFNPYIKFFWAAAGDSTVTVGKRGGTFDIEIGFIPTLKLEGYPVAITLPTWITVGPPGFWNGSSLGLRNVKSHFGVFTTGLKGIYSMTRISKRLGNWYIDGGVQYYYLINKNLLQAQKFTLGVSSIGSAHRSVVVASLGFGFGF